MMLHNVRLAVPVDAHPDLSRLAKIQLAGLVSQAWDDVRADRRVDFPCQVTITRRARLRLDEASQFEALQPVREAVKERLDRLSPADAFQTPIRYRHEFSTSDSVPCEVVVEITPVEGEP